MTVTVRQDGREIVCPLSEVTVLFCFLGNFLQNRHYYELFVLVVVEEIFLLAKKITELVPQFVHNSM